MLLICKNYTNLPIFLHKSISNCDSQFQNYVKKHYIYNSVYQLFNN